MQAALLVPVWVFAAALRLAGRRLGDTALPIDPQPKQPRPKWSKAEMRIVLTLPPDEALEQLPRRSASVIQTLRCRLRQEGVKLKVGDPVSFADPFSVRKEPSCDPRAVWMGVNASSSHQSSNGLLMLGRAEKAPILPIRRAALMCAANFNRPDSRPPPPFSTALNCATKFGKGE